MRFCVRKSWKTEGKGLPAFGLPVVTYRLNTFSLFT
jgi:hypothetical protein